MTRPLSGSTIISPECMSEAEDLIKGLLSILQKLASYILYETILTYNHRMTIISEQMRAQLGLHQDPRNVSQQLKHKYSQGKRYLVQNHFLYIKLIQLTCSSVFLYHFFHKTHFQPRWSKEQTRAVNVEFSYR